MVQRANKWYQRMVQRQISSYQRMVNVINAWFREQISSYYQRMVQRANMSLLTHGSESK